VSGFMGLLAAVLVSNIVDSAKTEMKNSEITEYSVSQVISHRDMYVIQNETQKYLCRSLTPCFGLYKGEMVLFTKNPVSYNGDKAYYMDHSECRIESCERVF